MNQTTLGLVRGLGVAVLMAVLTYLGDAAHLNGILSGSLAAIVSGVALMIEHSIEASSGSALFGAVKVRTQK